MFKRLTKRSLSQLAISVVLITGVTQAALANIFKSPAAPEGASVYIISPADGAEVTGPVTVVFGLKGMGVAPAGVDREKTGHHHLLVDQTTLPKVDAPMGNPPLHFGGGQTETTLDLEQGEHTLQLILGNHLHSPCTPLILSKKVTITVK
jgi:hypothetical protein